MRKQKQKFYKGKLTKRQKEIEKQKVGLALLLTIITVFGCYLSAQMYDWPSVGHTKATQFNTEGKRGRLPKADNVKFSEVSVARKIQIIADKHNFKWPGYLVRLARCESRLDPHAINNNMEYGVDRGLFQINSRYHPEVSNECAFDVTCSTKWTMDMINEGHQDQWACNDIILNQ